MYQHIILLLSTKLRCTNYSSLLGRNLSLKSSNLIHNRQFIASKIKLSLPSSGTYYYFIELIIWVGSAKVRSLRNDLIAVTQSKKQDVLHQIQVDVVKG